MLRYQFLRYCKSEREIVAGALLEDIDADIPGLIQARTILA